MENWRFGSKELCLCVRVCVCVWEIPIILALPGYREGIHPDHRRNVDSGTETARVLSAVAKRSMKCGIISQKQHHITRCLERRFHKKTRTRNITPSLPLLSTPTPCSRRYLSSRLLRLHRRNILLLCWCGRLQYLVQLTAKTKYL